MLRPCKPLTLLLVFVSPNFSAAQSSERPIDVRNSAPRSISGFQIETKPAWSLDLRRDLPAEPLYVVGAARTKDGTVVLESRNPRLLFYASDGKLVRALPVRSPTRSTGTLLGLQRVSGDTLAVLASHFGWIFIPGDTALTSISFAGARTSGPPSPTMLLAVLADRSSIWGLLDLGPQMKPPAKRFVDSMDVVVQSRTNEKRTLKRLPALMLGADSAGGSRQMWFSPYLVSAGSRDAFYYGFGTDYVISKLNPLTNNEFVFARSWKRHNVTAADIDQFIDGWSLNWNTGGDSVEVKSAMRKHPFAEFTPAFSQFLLSTNGELWVRNPNLIDAQGAGELNQIPLRASSWSIFDKDGKWLGDATLAAGFQPTDIGPNEILGVQYAIQENGVRLGRERSVALYRYSRR